MTTGALMATLVVYAYTSFTASWGPGPTIAKKFEEKCACHVSLVNAGDGGAILSRLKLEGPKTDADIVIGFDETIISKVKSELQWDSQFIPFDKGPYAFVYNSKEVKDPPKSLDDLLDSRWKGQILIEDPRLSTAGLGLLLWVIREKGDEAWNFFKKLRPQIKVISPSWDLAYGLFKKKQGLLVFSYWSSPAYHIQEEHLQDYKAALFPKGHYVQTEYMTHVPGIKNQELKKKFLEFMLSQEAQEEMPKKNFMYPVNKKAQLTDAFKKLGTVKTLPRLSDKELEHLEEWLKKWLEIFS